MELPQQTYLTANSRTTSLLGPSRCGFPKTAVTLHPRGYTNTRYTNGMVGSLFLARKLIPTHVVHFDVPVLTS